MLIDTEALSYMLFIQTNQSIGKTFEHLFITSIETLSLAAHPIEAHRLATTCYIFLCFALVNGCYVNDMNF